MSDESMPEQIENADVDETGQERETAPTEAQLEQIMADAREDALDFLDGLLDAMEVDGEVDARVEENGQLLVEITGPDSGLLIGRKGQTLDAIQELLRTVIQRQARTRLRIQLDVEGYRDRRRTSLEEKASEAAEGALQGDEIELEPMSAYDRKIVHDTIAGIEGVRSFSEGAEPRRRVVIQKVESS